MAELMFAANPLAGAGLSARAADVARRVADVVQTHCSTGSGAAETVAFLREWADSNGPGYEPQVGPLDLLAMRFDLTPEECDLVLLAGLPDEHEGVASTMRSLHPLAEPWPTVGLAALVLGGTGADRVQLRGLLSDGAAVRHRLVHVVSGPCCCRIGSGTHCTGTTRGPPTCRGSSSIRHRQDWPAGCGPTRPPRRSASSARTARRW